MSRDFWNAHYYCRQAADNFLVADSMPMDSIGNAYAESHVKWARDYFTTAAAALGYRLVAIEPEPVTDKPGFDGRDGGRWNERSTAQESV